ncbi:MAG: hypothetical protein BWK73_09325 [Thiothrix lacustris]|uniref:Uncharacterized protein n=1 Tax=Thiothrix lacustris TaxID=525917 RepID=A0A1Y1QV53_9GAMM|nr:MAG: hypothetical protein BWK73_09325 [Thiothrix lacustris]
MAEQVYKDRRISIDVEISMDTAQAASPVWWRMIGEEEWKPTPFQTADSAHNAKAMLKKVDRWLES